MDDLDRNLLNLLQASFPLVRRPYRALGEQLGLDEVEVLERVRRLRAERVLRQISAIFDTASLGYRSTLVAARHPAERLEAAAAIVNEHPGVTHNYERSHAFNLWYTLAVPPGGDLEATVRRLHELSGAEATRMLPTLKLLKIGVSLDMTGGQAADAQAEPVYSAADRERTRGSALAERDVAVVRELQEDLPAVEEPFAPAAERLGWSQEALLERAEDLLRRGFCRRVAAILRHRQAGFGANAMGVWAVPPKRVDEIGPRMASFKAVSHCYHRPTYPDWPYSIFTMVHGRSTEECEEVLAAISRETGILDYHALYSAREFKKVRLRYFTPETAAWEARYLVDARAP